MNEIKLNLLNLAQDLMSFIYENSADKDVDLTLQIVDVANFLLEIASSEAPNEEALEQNTNLLIMVLELVIRKAESTANFDIENLKSQIKTSFELFSNFTSH